MMHNCFLKLEFQVTFGSMFHEYTQSNCGGGFNAFKLISDLVSIIIYCPVLS